MAIKVIKKSLMKSTGLTWRKLDGNGWLICISKRHKARVEEEKCSVTAEEVNAVIKTLCVGFVFIFISFPDLSSRLVILVMLTAHDVLVKPSVPHVCMCNSVLVQCQWTLQVLACPSFPLIPLHNLSLPERGRSSGGIKTERGGSRVDCGYKKL